MKYFLFVLALCTTLFADDSLANTQYDFESGYTTITSFNYTVKVTAEERTTDNKLLVVVFPKDMGAAFTISNVTVGNAPPQYNLDGPAANITGFFTCQVNETNPIRQEMSFPVQISTVSEFTVSPDEALIQGNQFYTVDLPSS